jgi:hypothetical protein
MGQRNIPSPQESAGSHYVAFLAENKAALDLVENCLQQLSVVRDQLRATLQALAAAVDPEFCKQAQSWRQAVDSAETPGDGLTIDEFLQRYPV